MKGPSIMAEISIWSAAIIVTLMMFAASIGFVAAGILAGARSNSEEGRTTNQIQGMLARWSRGKQFGFIGGDDNQEHFVHSSEFKKIGMRLPEPGDRIAFTVERGAKGSRAVGPNYVTTPRVDQDKKAAKSF
jgi:cold shock CspA family protein